MVFSTEGFFEVAIESLPEWDLSLRPLNSVQALQPTELSDYIYIYIVPEQICLLMFHNDLF